MDPTGCARGVNFRTDDWVMSKKTETTGSGRTGTTRKAPLERSGLIRELQRLLFAQLDADVREAVQETGNDLFDAMEQARDNESRSGYMENIAALRKHREEVVDGFLRVHLDSFNAYFSGQGCKPPAAEGQQGQKSQRRTKLALLQKDEQEEDLLLHSMAGRDAAASGLDSRCRLCGYNAQPAVSRQRYCILAGLAAGSGNLPETEKLHLCTV